jgi:hypothetical protein
MQTKRRHNKALIMLLLRRRGDLKRTAISWKNTELSAKNKMKATGSVPVLRYIFGIINWHQEKYKKKTG